MLTLLYACQQDNDSISDAQLDARLESQLLAYAPPGTGVEWFRFPDSDDLANIPQDPRNPLTAQKVTLGRALFHETGMGRVPKYGAGYQQYSCASCHHAQAGFQACLPQGIGEGGMGFGTIGEGRVINPAYPPDSIDVQPIRSPSAMNAAWQEVMLWNGQFGAIGLNAGTEPSWTPGTPKEKNHLGFSGIETQAIAGLDVHRLLIDAGWVAQTPPYKALFDAAFPDVPVSSRYTNVQAGLAIAAYERTLIANLSPWQRYLRGNKGVMSPEEKEGALLFFGKAGCADCHNGPALNSMTFHALGMGDLQNGQYGGVINVTDDKPEHKGRGGFTGRAEDLYRFKTPQLYNLTDSPFFGHGATFRTIREVLTYKNNAVAQNPNVPQDRLSPLFKPLQLTEGELDALTLFLEKSLHDPFLRRYEPNSLPSGFCFPNNDPLAAYETGCQ